MKKIILLISVFLVTNIYSQPKAELRGVWLTNVDSKVLATDDNIVEAMNYLSSIGVNVVFPVVYNKGYTLYPSRIMDSLFNAKTIPDPSFQNRDFLDRLIIEAHRVGIEVIPWFEFGFSTSYSENGGHILAKFPSWALKNNAGSLVVKNGFDWMSAINPEAQNFMTSLIKEVIENYDVDGIQGDDRLPAMPVEGGYDEGTVNIYKAENNGANPPTNYNDVLWKKWRADKLTQYLSNLKSVVKSYGEYLTLSVSPTPYYWGYDQYLQDSKTWAQQGLTDHIIPQLYQYSLADYNYALNKTWTDVGQYAPDNFFAGVLMQVGSYTISSSLLGSMIDANRLKGVKGETFFFYEGLRKNSNELGNYLANNHYGLEAILPNRNGNVFRPKAKIINENSSNVEMKGSWAEYSFKGFEGKILRTNDLTNYNSLTYFFNISDEAFYDVFIFKTPNTTWTQNANYTLYNPSDSLQVIINQADLTQKGWHRVGTLYLEAGYRKVLKVDNKFLEAGKYLVSDAVMLMINRKLSPDVVVSVEQNKSDNVVLTHFNLSQNYPNPFNPTTTIRYSIPSNKEYHSVPQQVSLRVFDILGREVATLVNEEKSAGSYEVKFDGSSLTSGVYFYQLKVESYTATKKLLLLK